MTPLLSIQDLHVSVQKKESSYEVIRGVSFDIYPGEAIGLIGESGSGKSLTAKALLNLLPESLHISKGAITFNGKSLSSNSKEFLSLRGKEIGMIFQDPLSSLNPTMKIGKQLTEGYAFHYPHTPYAEIQSQALEMLHLVGIHDPKRVYDSYPHALSGGMRQRVMIALALLPKPKLLIADEPTTALDVSVQTQIIQLLQKIKTTLGTSILLITHDLSLAGGFCDKVAVMYGGKILEKASTQHLFSHPAQPYTQLLLKSIPSLDSPKDKPLISIEGYPPNLEKAPLDACPFASRCPYRMDRCVEKMPPLFAVEDTHSSACWLHSMKKESRHE